MIANAAVDTATAIDAETELRFFAPPALAINIHAWFAVFTLWSRWRYHPDDPREVVVKGLILEPLGDESAYAVAQFTPLG
jgi:hypothetical protein